jgi:4'-phosphopantetheinyl transferase
MLQVYLVFSDDRISEDREQEYLTSMPESVCASIRRYHRWEDRQATLFGKLLLQSAFRCRTGDRESSFLEQLEFTETGKPFIREGDGFNISHSGGAVVLALVDDGTVGVDIEKIRPMQIEDFSHYLPEVSDMAAFDMTDRLRMFYTCWTKKEAVLKGEGSGLQVPLEQVALHGDSAVFLGEVWHLRNIDCGAAYCCHVATSEQHAGCCIEVVTF